MKHLYLFTLLAALVCGSGILRAEPLTEPADTVDHFVIDNQSIRHFDGSQLVGKKIVREFMIPILKAKVRVGLKVTTWSEDDEFN